MRKKVKELKVGDLIITHVDVIVRINDIRPNTHHEARMQGNNIIDYTVVGPVSPNKPWIGSMTIGSKVEKETVDS